MKKQAFLLLPILLCYFQSRSQTPPPTLDVSFGQVNPISVCNQGNVFSMHFDSAFSSNSYNYVVTINLATTNNPAAPPATLYPYPPCVFGEYLHLIPFIRLLEH